MNVLRGNQIRAVCAAVLSIAAGTAMAQNATVTLGSEKQLIRGYGGISLPEWQGSDLSAAQRQTAFGNGDGEIGMSVLRIWINDDSTQWSKAVPTAQAAIAKGAIVFATPWYAVASARTTGGSGKYSINPSKFDDYVKFLNAFVAFMKRNNVDLYAISIQNEPDYASEWTYWSADQVYQFTLNYADKINCRVISAESFQYVKTLYDKILNDPKALANIDILGTHTYGTQVSAFSYPLADQKAPNLERWMTEHYTESSNDADLWPMALDVATDIHHSMVEGRFSVYTWWFIRRKYSPMKEDGTISKRGYCFAQYSKFVRPGAVRVDATASPASGVYLSAYKKADSVVVVAVNTNNSATSIKVSIPGIKSTSFTPYTTSSSKNLKVGTVGSVENEAISASLDAKSVTTFLLAGNLSSVARPLRPERSGRYQVLDPAGRTIGSVSADDPSALDAGIRRIAPRGGVYFAQPLDGGSATRVGVLP